MRTVLLLLAVLVAVAVANAPCDKAACLARAFRECGTGHAKAQCRAAVEAECEETCPTTVAPSTWKPESHRDCGEAACAARAQFVCGVGAENQECRDKFNARCRRRCLAKPVEGTELVALSCDRNVCFASSFAKCGLGDAARDCRKKEVDACMEGCDKSVTTGAGGITAAPQLLGCDHHDCTERAYAQCGSSPRQSSCRGLAYTACRGDTSSCLMQSFAICGTGDAKKDCRKRFVDHCNELCRLPEDVTEAPETTTPAPVTKGPCNEDVCLKRALAFCGGKQHFPHRHCKTEHFHYCMLDCPLSETTRQAQLTLAEPTRAPRTTSITTTSAAGPVYAIDTTTATPTIVPCSAEACKSAAEMVCGTTPDASACRITEERECVAHCTGSQHVTSLMSGVHDLSWRARCSVARRGVRGCRTQLCKLRSMAILKKCKEAEAIVCRRFRLRLALCDTMICRNKWTRAVKRQCTREGKRLMYEKYREHLARKRAEAEYLHRYFGIRPNATELKFDMLAPYSLKYQLERRQRFAHEYFPKVAAKARRMGNPFSNDGESARPGGASDQILASLASSVSQPKKRDSDAILEGIEGGPTVKPSTADAILEGFSNSGSSGSSSGPEPESKPEPGQKGGIDLSGKDGFFSDDHKKVMLSGRRPGDPVIGHERRYRRVSLQMCKMLHVRQEICRSDACRSKWEAVIVKRCGYGGLLALLSNITTTMNPFTEIGFDATVPMTTSTTGPTTTTVVPCSDEACRQAAVIVCGSDDTLHAVRCRRREVDRCIRHCKEGFTERPKTTAEPLDTTKLRTTTTTTVYSTTEPTTSVFFTSGLPARAQVLATEQQRLATFNMFRTTQEPTTPTPGKCDQNYQFDLYRACTTEQCRAGIRAFMDVCRRHNHDELAGQRNSLRLALAACNDAECKVRVRDTLQKVRLALLTQRIKTERLNFRHLGHGLSALREAVEQCETALCRKRAQLKLVTSLEKIVVSKSRVDSLRVKRFALQAEQRTIDSLKELVVLKEQRVECVTRKCFGRVSRRSQRALWRLSAAHTHFFRESKLYKLSQRMLNLVRRQARTTVELAKCSNGGCRHDMKRELKKLTRRVNRLHRRLERCAAKTHLARHSAVRFVSWRKFKTLRDKLLVKRAGCLNARCVAAFTKRIDLYGRIIDRVLKSRAKPHRRIGNSAEQVKEHAAVILHSNRDEEEEEEMQARSSKSSGKDASHPCLTKLANLHEKLSKAFVSGNTAEINAAQLAISSVKCLGQDGLSQADEDLVLDAEAVFARTVAPGSLPVVRATAASKVSKATAEVVKKAEASLKQAKSTSKWSCLEELANLHVEYSKALNKDPKEMTRIQAKMSALKCNDEESFSDDVTEAPTPEETRSVESALQAKCDARRAALHAQMAAALKAGNKREADRLEREIEHHGRKCRRELFRDCSERRAQVHEKKEELTEKLKTLAAEATACESERCRRRVERRVERAHNALSELEEPVC